jgi:hypothetical protein
MPHMIIEVARHTLERRMLANPVELNPDGTTADILAPPLSRQATVPSPFGPVRYRMVIRKVALHGTLGSGASRLHLDMDECSVELLSPGKSASMLVAWAIVPFQMHFVAAPANIASLVTDFSSTNVDFNFDRDSREKLAAELGPHAPALLRTLIAARMSLEFRALGAPDTGMAFNLTQGVPSEDLRTTDSLPGIVWADAHTLAVSVRYGPNPVPPTFLPGPFLAGATTIGMRLSNDGFQRTIRAQAVRGMAREMLSDRLRPGYERNAYLARGGQGEMTQADVDAGQAALTAFLQSPEGAAQLAAETPRPVGNGSLRRRVPMPNPFSSFTARIPELDLWLGNGTVEGRARAEGRFNGFAFTAIMRFRSRPRLVPGNPPRLEMHDLTVDDPDLRISLPAWLEWTVGILVGRLAGPLMGVIAGFLLSSIVAAIAKSFLPDDMMAGVGDENRRDIPGLPEGAQFTELEVVPAHMEMRGTWDVAVMDPRPHEATVRMVSDVVRHTSGHPTRGKAYFKCLGALGILADSNEHEGQGFGYTMQRWRSDVRLELVISELPLPITRSPWMVSVGYRSPAMYRFPVFATVQQQLEPSTLALNGPIWRPEPPMKGTVETRKFDISVERHGDDVFTLQVPAVAACIIISISTQVVDGSGKLWQVWHQVDIQNETLTFGSDYERFHSTCESGRKEWELVKAPSVLDRVWYPPDFHFLVVQRAIGTGQPGVVRDLGALVEARGLDGVRELLAPSLSGKR